MYINIILLMFIRWRILTIDSRFSRPICIAIFVRDYFLVTTHPIGFLKRMHCLHINTQFVRHNVCRWCTYLIICESVQMCKYVCRYYVYVQYVRERTSQHHMVGIFLIIYSELRVNHYVIFAIAFRKIAHVNATSIGSNCKALFVCAIVNLFSISGRR